MRDEVAKSLASRFLEEAVQVGASIGELQWACGMAQSAVLERVGRQPVLAADIKNAASDEGR